MTRHGTAEQAPPGAGHGDVVEIVRHGAVSVWLQPIVELRTGRVIGYEALARGPGASPYFQARDLFRAAADAGIAGELELLCRRRALEAKRRLLPPGQKIFINYDPRFFQCADECRSCGLVQALGIPFEEVVFEIAETCNLADQREARGELRLCRSRGYRFALDDLGVAYSSLLALVELRPDYAKIDTSLVAGADADPARAELIRLLVLYARSQEITLIAEGVESASLLQALLALGVEYAQGFFLGLPLPDPLPPAPEALAVIRRWRQEHAREQERGGLQ